MVLSVYDTSVRDYSIYITTIVVIVAICYTVVLSVYDTSVRNYSIYITTIVVSWLLSPYELAIQQ